MDPVRDLIAIQERLNRLFEDQLKRSEDGTRFTAESWSPPVDMYETDDEVVVAAELPGVRREDIVLEVTGTRMVLRGERKRSSGDDSVHRMERHYGAFERRLEVPESVDGGKAVARFVGGVLTVRLPKRSGGDSAAIRVEVGA